MKYSIQQKGDWITSTFAWHDNYEVTEEFKDEKRVQRATINYFITPKYEIIYSGKKNQTFLYDIDNKNIVKWFGFTNPAREEYYMLSEVMEDILTYEDNTKSPIQPNPKRCIIHICRKQKVRGSKEKTFAGLELSYKDAIKLINTLNIEKSVHVSDGKQNGNRYYKIGNLIVYLYFMGYDSKDYKFHTDYLKGLKVWNNVDDYNEGLDIIKSFIEVERERPHNYRYTVEGSNRSYIIALSENELPAFKEKVVQFFINAFDTVVLDSEISEAVKAFRGKEDKDIVQSSTIWADYM